MRIQNIKAIRIANGIMKNPMKVFMKAVALPITDNKKIIKVPYIINDNITSRPSFSLCDAKNHRRFCCSPYPVLPCAHA